uniref:Alpha-protein kinase 1 n=1 Tax=Geotrypetes seraphini TaxID=260995 RepID=A0A6P8S116_GEOSA|nr:alpha-protein kinase 1 [Geotrypetes seraphini]XP_033811484.1 alpha-protein kinase 1 [Geotrypetes seraphini]XP_033811494.1 alpha-protein kinase 1 [Geotrypetes seraphini]XP_033811502.1 alpha-protein kinase 1 [Geotrypetes seraphini]
MDNQNVMAVLEDCKQALRVLSAVTSEPSEQDKKEYLQCRDSLPDNLRTLIQEAKEMKWPFVPEKWQYKQAVGPEDKTNLQDMISAKLHELLIYLKTSISVRDSSTAAAVIFLIDRFLYWVDASNKLLQVAKGLHKLWPTTPIAPQVVIRQARISVNSGKLLKAEYILSSLINSSGSTGSWEYAKESDKVLVQSVCIQIRGQILQKLGMWYEAAELIWASIVGFFELPSPDKKGIATSLGILADIFISMSEEDYQKFKNNPQINLSLLEEFDHRLLSAAEACKLAAAFSLYTPLFVLTNVNIRGTCLLLYSFSNECLPEGRELYLSEAKESFEIGLLTKKDGDVVTSKQELHSFVKAAFCLTTVHNWLKGENEAICELKQLCREATEKLSVYSSLPEKQEKGAQATEIMSLVTSVKQRLHVHSFPNSDDKSYVPDSYKDSVKKSILHGKVSFREILEMHSHHHTSVCEVFENICRNHRNKEASATGVCITALKTETRNLDTACATEDICPRKDSLSASISKPSKNSRKFDCKGNRKLARSDAVHFSLDEETESEQLVKGRCDGGQNGKNSSSSCDNLSRSSSSWEEVDYVANNEMAKEIYKEGRNAVPTQHSTTSSEIPEENCDNSSHPLSVKIQHLSLKDSGTTCSASTQDLSQQVAHSRNLGETKTGSIFSADDSNISAHASSASWHPGADCKYSSSHPSRSNITVPSLSSESESFEMVDPLAETDFVTEERNETSDVIHEYHNTEKGEQSIGPLLRDKYAYSMVDPNEETVDNTEDLPIALPASVFKEVSTTATGQNAKVSSGSSLRNLISKPSSVSSVENGSFEMTDVDPMVSPANGSELPSNNTQSPGDHSPSMSAVQHSNTKRSPLLSLPQVTLVEGGSLCDTTEEGDGDQLSLMLSSKHSSTSSLRSWFKSSQLSSSFSEIESQSFLNSSGSSFVFLSGKSREQIMEARSLNDDDYRSLLSGVKHEWLMRRLKDTGIFKPRLLHQAYNALFLKYSKKSGLWTAQETAVCIGDYLTVDKKGKQRNAFWIHFLHQDEVLGRYVGKEYKDQKELLYHFSDVERQMTAQYYVTEFNKKLYELSVPTQIFYIPSAVLLILEDRTIKGCLSLEPYILGEFIKLSNNTKVVRTQYEATKYGLAFGHFTYEFSKHTDVVVDLQGWVTGSKKGEALIYLTDPQIHSIKHNDVSTNFGQKGIYFFFNSQHKECNEICHLLSLTRPSIYKPV